MIRHKSTACILTKVSKGFRYLVRLAVACNAAGVDYDITWKLTRSVGTGFRTYPSPSGLTDEVCRQIRDNNIAWLLCQPRATITVTAEKIPNAKPLPKAPPLRVVADWKPKFHDAEYKLKAYNTPAGWQPGFVITHSSGLSLLCPSSTGEWGEGANGGDADPTGKNWKLQHTTSGLGFGIQTTFARATKALLLATSYPVDWTQPKEALYTRGAREIGAVILAAFGNSQQKQRAASMQRRGVITW